MAKRLAAAARYGLNIADVQAVVASAIGGMITAPLLSMFAIPAAYRLMHTKK